jgi:hypothetical protein
MSLSAQEAADLVGLSKAAILKAIKTGKVSAQKDSNGIWRLEPVEVLRVWKSASDNPRQPAPESPQQSIAGLQRENELLRDTVNDLRRRLDAETEARNKEAEERRNLMLLLTDSRTPAPASQTEQPKGFWARLFR